jgi:hypothetical protein
LKKTFGLRGEFATNFHKIGTVKFAIPTPTGACPGAVSHLDESAFALIGRRIETNCSPCGAVPVNPRASGGRNGGFAPINSFG